MKHLRADRDTRPDPFHSNSTFRQHFQVRMHKANRKMQPHFRRANTLTSRLYAVLFLDKILPHFGCQSATALFPCCLIDFTSKKIKGGSPASMLHQRGLPAAHPYEAPLIQQGALEMRAQIPLCTKESSKMQHGVFLCF